MKLYKLFAAILIVGMLSSLAFAVKRDIEEADVIVWHRKLVTLRATLDNRTPQQRAEAASKRINLYLSQLPELEIRAVHIQADDWKGQAIMAGSNLLFRISPDDLPPDGSETLDQASAIAVKQVRDLIEQYKKQRRWPELLKSIGFIVLATIVLLGMLWVIRRICFAAQQRIHSLIDLIPTELKFLVVDPRPTLHFVCKRIINLLGVILCFFSLYLWLTFALTQFPYTHPLGAKLGALLWTTISGLFISALSQLPDLITLVIIFYIARFAARWVGTWYQAVEEGKITVDWLDAETARATRRLIIIAIWLGAIIIAYPYIPGAGTEAFKGVSVFIGLMLSLGSAGIVHQVMSGLVVIYSRAIKVGDRIIVDSTKGKVVELGLLATKIITPYDEIITIPNAVIVNNSIHNFTANLANAPAVLHVSIYIGYEHPWRQVDALMLLAADRTEGLKKSPPPSIFHCTLGKNYIEYEICVCLERLDDKVKVMSRLHTQILDAFNEYGIQMMVPEYEGQPEKPLVVPKSQWHTAPAKLN